MIQRNFRNTVSALCYSFIDLRFQGTAIADNFPHNLIVQFVIDQQKRMPDYLQFPLLLLTLIFDGWGLVRRGSYFHCQPPSLRQIQIQDWKNSPFPICRDIIRFYESLVVLYWESHV